MVQGAVTFIAVAYVCINLAVDVFYAILDPRVTVGGREGRG